VLDAVATMGSSYGFPVIDAIGRSIALSNEQRYPALCRVVRTMSFSWQFVAQNGFVVKIIATELTGYFAFQAVTSARMGLALKELLFRYNWKRLGLLYRPGPYSLAVTEGILNEVSLLAHMVFMSSFSLSSQAHAPVF